MIYTVSLIWTKNIEPKILAAQDILCITLVLDVTSDTKWGYRMWWMLLLKNPILLIWVLMNNILRIPTFIVGVILIREKELGPSIQPSNGCFKRYNEFAWT